MTIERASIPEQVAEFLAAQGITYTVSFVGATKRDNMGGAPWECDEWRPIFRRTGTAEKPARKGSPDLSRPYFTGKGHREKIRGFKAAHIAGAICKGGTWEAFRPKAPDAAGVLYSLILDGRAVEMSFVDWCDEMGDNPDSIRALDTYRECCAIGQEMRAFFTAEERQTLADMLADY